MSKPLSEESLIQNQLKIFNRQAGFKVWDGMLHSNRNCKAPEFKVFLDVVKKEML